MLDAKKSYSVLTGPKTFSIMMELTYVMVIDGGTYTLVFNIEVCYHIGYKSPYLFETFGVDGARGIDHKYDIHLIGASCKSKHNFTV